MLMMTVVNVFFDDGGDKSSDVLPARSIAEMDEKDNIMLLFFYPDHRLFICNQRIHWAGRPIYDPITRNITC